MLKYFHLERRASFPGIFLVFVLLLYPAGFLLFADSSGKAFWQPKNAFELLFAVIGASAGFVYFLYNQHYKDTQTFMNLFEKFNSRYDKINEQLNEIISRPTDSSLTSRQIDVLYDYFNLCAEEYLFYKAGYIDERVWSAWLKGMKYFLKDPVIRRVWQSEIDLGSYYEFKLDLIK